MFIHSKVLNVVDRQPIYLWCLTHDCHYWIRRYMGVCRLNETGYGLARRIDIMGIVQEEWVCSHAAALSYGFLETYSNPNIRGKQACAVTYFTGSGAFNRKMRQHAVEAGYTLNEHALVSSVRQTYLLPPVRSLCRIYRMSPAPSCNTPTQCPLDPKTKAKGTPLVIPDERCAYPTRDKLSWLTMLRSYHVNAGPFSRRLS